MDTARKTAYDTLLRIFKDGAYSNLALSAALRGGELSAADSAFASALVYTTVERRITIDYNLSLYLKDPLKKLRSEVCTALRMGAAQILFMDKVPDSAAVNESVRILKQSKKFSFASGLCNAVLRKVSQNGLRLPEGDSIERRSVCYSMPQWLVRLWDTAYGEDESEQMMASSFGGTDISIRVNTLRTSADALFERLCADGIAVKRCAVLPDALILQKCGAPEKLAAFREGLFHVQDIASQLCCKALDAKPGQTVYDVCAAPGGKSFTLSQYMENTGSLCSYELHAHRAELIRQGAQRLGLTNLQAFAHDALVFDESRQKADRVLCDVPCAGLGVIAKKPEIRYKKTEDIDNLPDLQYNILCISSQYLKQNGILVYSTCSLNPAENEAVCERFLQTHPQFQPIPILPDVDKREVNRMVTLLPHRTASDGFFITAFTKTE